MALQLFIFVLFASHWWMACPKIITESAADPAGEEEGEPTPPANFSQANKRLMKNGKKSMENIKTLVAKMRGDSSTKHMIPGSSQQFTTKIATVGKKWVQASKAAYAADQEGMAERISGAISGAGEGLVGIVNGIKDKDWKTGVQGALTIASSVAQLAGPVGMIAASVLSFISSILDLFGGSSQTESMDDKIERIVKEQVDIGREKNLKAEVEGVRMEFASLSTSVQHFRESKKLKEHQANELYNHVFGGLMAFGKLRDRINEICDDITEYDPAIKCLGIISLYAEVSILRQLILTDMASLMADVKDAKSEACARNANKLKRKFSRRDRSGSADLSEAENDCGGNLLVVANNILNIIKKEQESDSNFLLFMTNPFNFPKRRYVISLFFSNPEKYSSLNAYIHSLNAIVPDGMFKDYVMICSGTRLREVCNTLTVGNYADLNTDPMEWQSKVKSVFIPLHLQITGFSETNFGGKTWGPFPGPNSLTELDGDQNAKWKSVKVETSTRNADKEVRICQREKLLPGVCDSVPIGDYILEGLHGSNWKGKIKSFQVPSGLMLSGKKRDGQRDISYSYYVGADTVNWAYDYSGWYKIAVATSVTPKLDAAEQVKYCDAENLQGYCKTTWTSVNYFRHFFGMSFSVVKSLKIPGGLRVTGYSERDYKGARYGPYTGPALISKLDPLNKWVSMKISKFGEILEHESMEKDIV